MHSLAIRGVVPTAALFFAFAAPAAAQLQWAPPEPYPDALVFTHVATGDLNGDGLPDVARLSGPNRLSLHLGTGTGSFSSGRRPVDSSGRKVLIGEFDGNSFDDTVVMAPVIGGISRLMLFRSDGLGSVVFRTDLFPAGTPYDMALADMDVDGALDIVAALSAGATSGVQIFYGDGAGLFPRTQIVGAGAATSVVAAADMNADGLPDLLQRTYVGRTSVLSIRLAAAGSTYPVALTFTLPYYQTTATQLEAVDLDGDGAPEIVVGDDDRRQVGVLTLFRGTVATGFAILSSIVSGPLISAAFGDLDGNGRTDLLIADLSVSFAYLADGTGGFVRSAFALTGGERNALADVDRNGYDDAVGPRDFALNLCHEVRRGTVNAGSGTPADVLLVNGSIGEGRARTVSVDDRAPLAIAMGSPPSRAGRMARFCLYAWMAVPRAFDAAPADALGVGRLALPTPFSGGFPQPVAVWNNFSGADDTFGPATRFSRPAPSVVLSRPGGAGRGGAIFLQGVIRDDRGPNGFAAATNAIQLFIQ